MNTFLGDQAAAVSQEVAESRIPSFRHSYNEIGDQHITEIDVLEQLKSNLALLEDMHSRMSFMMKEVSYLLRRS